MVQTRSSAARSQSGQGHEPQNNTVDPLQVDNAALQTKRRRQDGAESPKKRRRRKRDELCQLNLDVLFLIAEYIHPMDLLNLARTCKSLRELLMSKSSAFVWKTARLQVNGLPDCPADLTEPEYANLVFCARCYSCGKPAKTVLWRLRRRYCLKCKPKRLCEFYSCDEIIRRSDDHRQVLAAEYLAIDNNASTWVDQDQMESFLDEYHRSVDKDQFLDEKKEQYKAICRHARDCYWWQKGQAMERRENLELRRYKREQSIFEKLRQHGYGPEIEYFGAYQVRSTHKAVFRKSRPLTSKEWDQMWPEWRKIMDDFRLRRMHDTVYQPRQNLLEGEYNTYVEHPTPDGPTFDILPHVTDLAHFGPFRDIIRAPEGTQINDTTFVPAFAQLPDLIEGWKKCLDAEFAELVKIPLHLSPENAPNDWSNTSKTAEETEAPQTDLNKLHIACALFRVAGTGCYTYLDALSVSMRGGGKYGLQPTGSSQDKFRIEFFEEAPYIVRACGLDPRVATADDMDRRNARLRCVVCKDRPDILMNWRCAMRHACCHIKTALTPLSEMSRWELVSDKPSDKIQGVVESDMSDYTRCLLCRRRVGDATPHIWALHHLVDCHNVAEHKITEGVHYTYVDTCVSPPKVEMVEEE